MACLGYISKFTLDVPRYFARSFWMTSSGQQRWFGINGCQGIFDKIAIRKFEVCTVTTDDLEGLGAWPPAATMINNIGSLWIHSFYCPACRTSLIATRFWVVVICPIIKCLTVLEFSLILFDLCLFITIFNFILNYVPIVTFWIFTYHKIWILLIIFCFIWSYWIINFLTCLEVFWSVVS